MKTSVALCTYNGERFLSEQIDSILAQSIKVDEIVVCDDQSKDGTIEILTNYQKQFPDLFKIFINDENLRSVKNFEKAISLCTNEIIFLCDQDDIWIPEKVEKCLEYFKGNDDVSVIASNGFGIDSQGKILDMYSFWDLPQIASLDNLKLDLKEVLTKITNIATGSSMAVRASFLKQVIPFPDGKNLHHDEWIAFIAAKQNTFALLDEKLFYYRIHQQQQVGGVFFAKNNKSILFLKRTFGMVEDFEGLSKYIKRLCDTHKRNGLYLKLQAKHHDLLISNRIEIENLFHQKKDLIRRNFPIRSMLLFLLDFKNKREI